MSDLSFTEVGEILRLLQGVEGTHVELEWGDLKLQVRRGGSAEDAGAGAGPAPIPVVAADPARTAEPATDRALEAPTEEPAGRTSPSDTSGTDIPAHWVAVSAPMVGTFYRSPKPEEPPYVEVGDVVAVGDTVALVEVMKLFTELKADASGKVARIDAADSSMVEFGQVLIWIEPA